MIDHVEKYISEGEDQKEAIKKTAKDRGVPKRDIYNENHKAKLTITFKKDYTYTVKDSSPVKKNATDNYIRCDNAVLILYRHYCVIYGGMKMLQYADIKKIIREQNREPMPIFNQYCAMCGCRI